MELTDEQADKIIEFGEARKNGTLDKKGSEYSEEELDMLSKYNEAASGADEILDEEVESCISSQASNYDHVLEDFRNEDGIAKQYNLSKRELEEFKSKWI